MQLFQFYLVRLIFNSVCSVARKKCISILPSTINMILVLYFSCKFIQFQFYLVRLISCSRYLPTWSNEISILPSTINIHFARHSFVSACISILPSTINILLPPSSHVICIFISILPSTINIWISLLLQELLNKFQFYLVRLIFNKSDSPSKTITKFQFYLVRLILTVLKLLTLHFAISILPSTINKIGRAHV